MHDAWVSHVKTGDPGWPHYRPQHPVVQRMGEDWELVPAPQADVYAAWAATKLDAQLSVPTR